MAPRAAQWAEEFEQQVAAAEAPSAPLGEERAPFQAADWADQYAAALSGRGGVMDTNADADWADQFASGLADGGEWAQQFGAEAEGAAGLQQVRGS